MPDPEDTIAVSNEVFTLVVQSATAANATERHRLLGQALIRSCDYLQRLQPRQLATTYDRVVAAGDQQASAQSVSRRASALQLVATDPDHFREFLLRETQLLIQAGMSRSIVDWLMSRVHARIMAYIGDTATGAELSQALDVLRDRVCWHRDIFLQRQRHQGGNIVVLTLGGICFIVVDTLASNVLSPIGMAASCSIGGGLLKDAVKELLVTG